MFDRPHHQAVASVLTSLDADLLAEAAYGEHVYKAYRATLRKLAEPAYFAHCCAGLSIAALDQEGILERLDAAAP